MSSKALGNNCPVFIKRRCTNMITVKYYSKLVFNFQVVTFSIKGKRKNFSENCLLTCYAIIYGQKTLKTCFTNKGDPIYSIIKVFS